MKTVDFLKQGVRIAVLIAIIVSISGAALAWTGPTTAPPNGNVSAPINTSATAQTKSGVLYGSNFCLTSPSVCMSTVLFGGGYQLSTVAGCYVANWVTGGCSCPSYAPYSRWVYYMDTNSTYGGGRGYLCSS
jgi:hypothetical protein